MTEPASANESRSPEHAGSDAASVQHSMVSSAAYNQRLFGRGMRGWFHGGRFRWLARQCGMPTGEAPSVLELGCYDGKAIRCFSPLPARYLGLDANWEGGLDLARKTWGEAGFAEFRTVPVDALPVVEEQFDIGLCMETMEHLPDELLENYIDLFASCVRGRMIVTVPNEIGPLCAAKQITKKFFFGGSIFSWADIANAAIGRTSRIVRDEHRGFDYRRLVKQLRRRFEVERVEGIPFSWLPPWLNFTVGIVLKPLQQPQRR